MDSFIRASSPPSHKKAEPPDTFKSKQGCCKKIPNGFSTCFSQRIYGNFQRETSERVPIGLFCSGPVLT